MIITRDYTKQLLGITSTKYDDRIDALIPVVQSDVLKYCEDYFEILTDRIYRSSNTISFTASEATPSINDSENKFIELGFVKGLHCRVNGSKINDNIFEIKEIQAGKLITNLKPVIIDEANDDTIVIRITLVKFPEGIQLPVARLIGSQLKSQFGIIVSSEKFDDFSATYSYDDLLKGLSKWRKAKAVPVQSSSKFYNIMTKR